MFDNDRAPQGAKDLIWQCFLSPFQGSPFADSYQGFASLLTPGYFLIAPSGLAPETGFATETN
jgi:hypothetical protein